MGRLWVSVFLPFTLLGCGDDRRLDWRFEFEDQTLRSRTAAIGAELRAGGCTGPVIYSGELRSMRAGPTPPELGPGTYGFSGVARDSRCVQFAEACVEATLPLDQNRIEVVLVTRSLERESCPASRCAMGSCVIDPDAAADGPRPADSGPIDAPSDGCSPSDEVCNGEDDDCDRTVDEGLPIRANGLCRHAPRAVSAGSDHSCVLLAGGEVWCWGRNESGQLGDGTRMDSTEPVQVLESSGSLLANVTAIDSGARQTCALLASGEVRCWGRNENGELGDGTVDNRATAVAPFGLNPAEALATGGFHTCVIEVSGAVKCWGLNSVGQLGSGPSGSQQTVPVVVDGLENVVELSANYQVTCARHSGGTVSCWGQNDEGQTGSGTITPAQTSPVDVVGMSNAISIASGWNHQCAARRDGTVRCWGQGAFGALGSGNPDPAPSGVVVVGVDDAVLVRAGGFTSCALDPRGRRRCWGINDRGQLGDGANAARFVPSPPLGSFVALSDANNSHTCGVRDDYEVVCWGNNAHGQLGRAAETDPSSADPLIVSGLP
ncbi:MAG: hypothetical protein AAGF12_22970 [Myxococcota bacterium]